MQKRKKQQTTTATKPDTHTPFYNWTGSCYYCFSVYLGGQGSFKVILVHHNSFDIFSKKRTANFLKAITQFEQYKTIKNKSFTCSKLQLRYFMALLWHYNVYLI